MILHRPFWMSEGLKQMAPQYGIILEKVGVADFFGKGDFLIVLWINLFSSKISTNFEAGRIVSYTDIWLDTVLSSDKVDTVLRSENEK